MSLRLALTGGIGSGKSTVAAAFARLGATIVDADIIAREVVAAGTPGFDAVIARFGEEVIGADGELNRPALGAIVFADDAARADLNAIVHPAVRDEAARQVSAAHAADRAAITIEDIPLLAETSGAAQFHAVIVVRADVNLRIARLLGRGLSKDAARARMQAQATDAERTAIADMTLDNDGTIEELHAHISGLWSDRILPFSEALVQSAAPAPTRVRETIARLPYDARQGMIERAARRLEFQWSPLEGRVDGHNACSDVDLVVAAMTTGASVRHLMGKAGFVPDGAGRFVSADPGAWVLVAFQHLG